MVLIGLGALLVLGGILYMARATIWRGSLSRPAGDTLEPTRPGVGFVGSERTGRAFSLWQSVPFCWCWGPASSLSHPPSCCLGHFNLPLCWFRDDGKSVVVQPIDQRPEFRKSSPWSANGMVRPCSCPASKRSWQGAPKTRSTPCLRHPILRSP